MRQFVRNFLVYFACFRWLFFFCFFWCSPGLSSSHFASAAHDFHMFLQLYIAQTQKSIYTSNMEGFEKNCGSEGFGKGKNEGFGKGQSEGFGKGQEEGLGKGPGKGGARHFPKPYVT